MGTDTTWPTLKEVVPPDFLARWQAQGDSINPDEPLRTSSTWASPNDIQVVAQGSGISAFEAWAAFQTVPGENRL